VPTAPPRRRRRRRGRRTLVRRILLNLTALLVFVVMVFPVFWMVSTAFKPGQDIQRYHPKWLPIPGTLLHFTDAIRAPYFWNNLLNSLIVVLSVVALSIVLAFLAALALAKFRFYGRKAFIVMIIAVQTIPLNALIIPLYVVLARYHQTGKLTGVVITYLTFVLPFCIWTLRGFLIGIPRELEEAAMVDGNSRFGAFVRILLPLVAPGLVATSIFAFIQAWNEYILAYVLLTDQKKYTLTIWLSGFLGSPTQGSDFGALMAGATLTSIPVIVFFLLLHRRIAFGLTAGAVKG
jgi:N,N'-diacetylchitobiose transport system permease protein